jgi:anaphase-promoting complex subunit 5
MRSKKQYHTFRWPKPTSRPWKSIVLFKDVQYLLSVIYHNLGMMTERDEVASRHSQMEEHQKRLEGITFDPLYQNVFELVAKVGAALASRK